MIHRHCHENGIKDTSRGNTYHNKNFKTEAEKRGLIIGFDKRIGHSKTSPNDSFIDFVNYMWKDDIDLHRKYELKLKGKTGKKSSTIKYICPVCGQSIRATKIVNIGCLDCDVEMICRD